MFAIFHKLGGQDKCLNLLRERGQKRPTWPGKTTLQKWSRVGALPGPIILDLMEIAERRRIAYRARDFVAPGGRKMRGRHADA